jgi:hypothetical protein
MRKLYKITLIITIIVIIIIFWIEQFIQYHCKNIIETNIHENFTFEKCSRLYNKVFSSWLFEIFMLINWVLIIFSIAWLISDWIHFLINKIKKKELK